jgi:hypothetical protein
MCGSTSAQNNTAAAQSAFYTQATTQASQAFGASSSVFNTLQSTFAPTIAAGPSQQGFSQQENANMQSQAITQTGQAYKNAKEALGESQDAVGGGNTPLPSGTTTGQNLQLAESGANQTASELGQITQANYAQGNANYNAATSGLLNATNAYNAGDSAANAATGAGSAAANTENQIAQENNSWVNAAIGALGGIAGNAVTGGMNMLQNGIGSAPSGGGNYITPGAYQSAIAEGQNNIGTMSTSNSDPAGYTV